MIRHHIKKIAAEKLIRNSMEKDRIVQHTNIYNARGGNQKRNYELGLQQS